MFIEKHSFCNLQLTKILKFYKKKSQDVVGDIIDLLVFKVVLVLLYLRRIESLVGFV